MSNQYLKKRVFLLGIISTILIIWLASVSIAQAITVEELLKQIAELQAKIKALQEQLAELEKPAIYEGIPAGFSFENNLKYGMRNNEVKYLQIILKK